MVRSVEPSVSHKRLEGFFFLYVIRSAIRSSQGQRLVVSKSIWAPQQGGHSCQWRYDEGDGCFMAIGTSLPSALSSGRRIVHAPGHQGFTNVSESGWGGARWVLPKRPEDVISSGRCYILRYVLINRR